MPIPSLQQEIAERWGDAPRRYRVAIVGCGRIARAHAAALRQHPAAELVALCDVDPDAVRTFGVATGVSGDGQFTDYEELLDTVRPDAVHVCTWPDAHAAVTRAAAGRGVHVYCEKPIALDLDEADGMIAACREADVALGINHHRRGDARFLRAKELIAQGEVGALRVMVGDHGGGAWRMMSQSTHLYDLFRFLAGDAEWAFGHVLADGRPARAEDVYEIAHEGLVAGDEVSAQFGFRRGVYAYHDGLGHVDVELAGTHGRLLFHEGVARKPWPFGEARAAWVQYPEGDGGRQAKRGPDAWRPLDGLAREELDGPAHAHGRMIDRFLRAVDSRVGRSGDEAPLCVGEDGRGSLEMALGIYASHFSGRRVELPLGGAHPLAAMAGADPVRRTRSG
jgi:predicted dehydrogenase